MAQVYLAAEHAQPLSPSFLAAREQAERIAFADPHLLASPGRQSGSVLAMAANTFAHLAGCPTATVTFFPTADIALADTAQRMSSPMTCAAIDRNLIIEAVNDSGFTPLAVDAAGHLTDTAVAEAMKQGATGIIIGQVNAEIGTLHDIEAIAASAHAHHAIVVVDATSSAGRVPLPPPDSWDVLVLSGHSWGGGEIGVRIAKPGWSTQTVTTAWQSPARSPLRHIRDTWPLGSPPIATCAASAVAFETALADLAERYAHDRQVSQDVRNIMDNIPFIVLYGDERRAPHIVSLSALYIDAEALVSELDRQGIAVSSGSACTSLQGTPSHVLQAIGGLTSGNIRLTLPLHYDSDDVLAAAKQIVDAIGTFRAEYGLHDR